MGEGLPGLFLMPEHHWSENMMGLSPSFLARVGRDVSKTKALAEQSCCASSANLEGC